MNHPQAAKIQPQRQCPEPIRDFLLSRRPLDNVQKCLMLLPIPRRVMIPQEVSRPIWIWSHPRDRVELMVTENALRTPRFRHRPHDPHSLELFRAPIDEVADKHSRAVRMTPRATPFGIAQAQEQQNQLVVLAMEVADDIELNYALWPFGDEIVADNARVFTEQYGIKVSLQPTSGDYAAVMETKLVSGTRLDLFRAQRGQASRWFAAQWIRPIDDMPGLDKIKMEEFPAIGADALSWPDRKRIGLTYYNGGPYCMFRNEKVLSAGGYEATANPGDYPQTWDEIYKQSVDLKNINLLRG